jgi:hypothetical protein
VAYRTWLNLLLAAALVAAVLILVSREDDTTGIVIERGQPVLSPTIEAAR